MRVVLHMVMGFIIMIVFAQLWLFTVSLDAAESKSAPPYVTITAVVCSFAACAAVWSLLMLFLRTERSQF
jgi:hypothetical protein